MTGRYSSPNPKPEDRSIINLEDNHSISPVLFITGRNAFAKSFGPCQLARADMDETFCYLQFSACQRIIPHPNLICCMGFNAVFNTISVISQRPVHLPMLSWSSIDQYSAQYSFQATGCFPNEHLEIILSR